MPRPPAGSGEQSRSGPRTAAARPATAGYLRMLVRLAASGLRERMQYRFNFVVSFVLRGAVMIIDFALVAVILYRFGFVGGWDVYEIALLYGTASAAQGLYRTFADELERFETYLIDGRFDGILVRPWPTLMTLLARRFDFNRIGVALQGAAIAGIGTVELLRRGTLGYWGLPYVFLLPLLGAAVLFALSTATAALGFWLLRIDELQVFTMYAPLTASFYPLSIYPRWLKGMLYTILPMAYINYLPALYLLGKGAGPWALALSPAVAVVTVLAAYRFWLYGERHYQSPGT